MRIYDVNVNSDLSNKIGSMNIYILYLEKCFKGLAVGQRVSTRPDAIRPQPV